MKILMVLCRNPFASGDGANYAIKGSLRLLAASNQVSVCGFGRDFLENTVGEFPCAGSLGSATNRPLQFAAATLFGKSYTAWKYGTSTAKRRLSRILQRGAFDVLWFEQTQSGFAADWIAIARELPNLRTVLRSHNIEANVVGSGTRLGAFAEPLMRREARSLKYSETEVWRSCDAIAAISKDDEAVINAELGEEEAKALCLPVVSPTPMAARSVQSHKNRTRIVFVGDCRWKPNRDAALWIVNRLAVALKRTSADVEIQLVGHETERIAKHVLPIRVRAMGYVDRVEPIYQSAICALAPIHTGGGVNIKVIESFAQGLPVIGSPMAKRGIECDAFLVANTEDEYCSLIRELLECPETWERLSSLAASFEEKSTETASRAIQTILAPKP